MVFDLKLPESDHRIPDFDYVAELAQAKELEEQDEYRNDRAVHVSSK